MCRNVTPRWVRPRSQISPQALADDIKASDDTAAIQQADIIIGKLKRGDIDRPEAQARLTSILRKQRSISAAENVKRTLDERIIGEPDNRNSLGLFTSRGDLRMPDFIF